MKRAPGGTPLATTPPPASSIVRLGNAGSAQEVVPTLRTTAIAPSWDMPANRPSPLCTRNVNALAAHGGRLALTRGAPKPSHAPTETSAGATERDRRMTAIMLV